MARAAVALVCCLAGATLYAQTPEQPPTIDLVLDNPQASRTPLTAADVVVAEGGEPRAIQSVRFVRPGTDGGALVSIDSDESEHEAAAAADRLVGVYVDEYHLENDDAFAAARSALAAFIRTALGPRDLVLVVKPLDALVSLRLSADRDAAARIIETASPRQSDYTPRSSFEREFIAGAPARIEAARSQIAFSGINAVAQHLGRFPAGRKTLIVLSNGIARTAPSRGDGPLPSVESIARVANRARVAIYPIRPSAPSHEIVAAPVDTAARSGRADAASGFSRTSNADPLGLLASQTTGLLIESGDVTVGLQRLLHDASSYYVLTLEPRSGAPDGRLHAVTVSLRTSSVAFRARSAYAMPRPATASAAVRASLIPEGLKIPRRVSPLIRTWFGQSAGRDGATDVAFVWEPAPRTPGVRGVVVVPARVAMTVSTLDGAEVYSGASAPSGAEPSLAPSDRPELTFSARPGRLLVQMDVLDPAGRVLDRDVRDVTVTAFRGPLAFGSPSVYRSRSARDVRTLLAGSSSAAPVASRQFSRAEHLVVTIPVVTDGGTGTDVTVRLQSRFGSVLRELPVSPSRTRPGDVQVDMPLAPLASGGYVLEFSARSPQGSATERLEFVVTP